MKHDRLEIYVRILWSIECGKCRIDSIYSNMQVDKNEFLESIRDLIRVGIIEEDTKPAYLGNHLINIFSYRINHFNYMIFRALKAQSESKPHGKELANAD